MKRRDQREQGVVGDTGAYSQSLGRRNQQSSYMEKEGGGRADGRLEEALAGDAC